MQARPPRGAFYALLAARPAHQGRAYNLGTKRVCTIPHARARSARAFVTSGGSNASGPRAKERRERVGDNRVAGFVQVRFVRKVDVLAGLDAGAQGVGGVAKREGRLLAELAHRVILGQAIPAHRVEVDVAVVAVEVKLQ